MYGIKRAAKQRDPHALSTLPFLEGRAFGNAANGLGLARPPWRNRFFPSHSLLFAGADFRPHLSPPALQRRTAPPHDHPNLVKHLLCLSFLLSVVLPLVPAS